MSVWAVRDGKAYRPGDDGFGEAWGANMRDVVDDVVRQTRKIHDDRMKADAAYRSAQEALDRDYDCIFGGADQ